MRAFEHKLTSRAWLAAFAMAGLALASAGVAPAHAGGVPTRDAVVPGHHGETAWAAAYNNVGITLEEKPTAGDLDGAGRTLSAQALTAAGWGRGALVRINGMDFALPDTAPGTPDNVVAAGQRIALNGSGSALGFLALATSSGRAPVGGSGTIVYADGSSQPYQLSAGDWRSDGPGVAVALPVFNTPAGPVAGEGARLFVREVPLTPGKIVRLVTLPAGGGPALHVFSVGWRALPGAWRGTWATAQHAAYTPAGLSETTFRLPVRTSVAGSSVRIRLMNGFTARPLMIGHATVALRASGAAVRADSLRDLTFAGARRTTIPGGGEAVTDAAVLDVPAHADLVVSLYLSGPVASVSQHWLGLQTVYWTAPGAGDHSADAHGQIFSITDTTWPFLSAVDVTPRGRRASAIVALGDSITDGAASTPDTNRRWPDLLAARLGDRGVLNAGITGNRITGGVPGNPSALDRLDRDVFAQTGAKTLILCEGVNDVKGTATAEQIIAGMKEIAARAHARGMRVIGATIVPFRGWAEGTSDGWTLEKEAKRQRVNRFVRSSGGVFDAVADFDEAVRSRAAPERFAAALDSGDHLHPNDAGMAALADAVAVRALALAP